MATAESHFVRQSPDRSSRNLLTKVTPPGQPVHNINVEAVRQRAQQAVEYYHNNVRETSVKGADPGKVYPIPRANGAPGGDTTPQEGQGTSHSDAYYKHKLRTGYINLRNSYNEKRPRGGAAYNRGNQASVPPPRKGLRRVNEGIQASNAAPSSRVPGSGPRIFNERRGLYRSNSSLELFDNDEEVVPPAGLRRDYGSASSLDVISNSGESFFAMLQDYRNENVDQRAPPPPQVQDLLRGRQDSNPTAVSGASASSSDLRSRPAAGGKMSNGSVPVEDEAPSGGDSSPRLHKKSQKSKDKKPRNKSVVTSGGGIFHKLRGKSESTESNKLVDSNSETDAQTEERQKKKAFVHYDCQSIGVNLGEVVRRRLGAGGELNRRNTTTGASAAASDISDQGDGKNNDLVQSCAFFRNELGGEEERAICLNRSTAQKRVQQLLGNRHVDKQSMMRCPACNGVAVLDTSQSPHGVSQQAISSYKGMVIEYVDQGAFYYRNFFSGFEHQNFFGVDDSVGPVALSLKREKVDERERETSVGKVEGGGPCFMYRLIVRTSELTTLRGCILEEAIPSSTRLSSTRGLPAKDVIEYVIPDLNLTCLKGSLPGPKTAEQLMKLDEQGITKTYKIGVMYCRAGQSTEEEMYNNCSAGSAFDEFIESIGKKVRLKGFNKYRGGLDCKADSTGTHSLYAELDSYEIMFHVSTLLPYTPNNRQQLLRKRHIGNDIVTIVFQEPGALPFTPKSVRSQFQHVFIVVRVHSPNTDHTKYSISITRSKDVPPFGPPIPSGAMYNKGQEFTEFLLIKALNAENAVHRSEKFTAMATRTRQEYLKDLAANFVGTTPLDSGSKLSKFSLGSGRKKDRGKLRAIPDVFAKGATTWKVQLEDFGQSEQLNCYLGLSGETLVLIEEEEREVIFTSPCKSVIGWTPQGNCLRLFYNNGECVVLRTMSSDTEEVAEIITRLLHVTPGAETVDMLLQRNAQGQLGFHVHYEGIVSEVDHQSYAYRAGLRQGSRLVEICKVATATLTHEQTIDLLRTSVQVSVVVIPPHEDGSPRKGVEETPRSHSSPPTNLVPITNQLLALEEERVGRTAPVISSRIEPPKHNSRLYDPRLISPPQAPTYSDLRNFSSHPASNVHSNGPDLRHYPGNNAPPPPVNPHGKQLSVGMHERTDVTSGQGSNLRHDDLQTESQGQAIGGSSKEIEGSGWSGRVTIYPAYKDPYQESQGSLSPRTDVGNPWSGHGNTQGDQEYDNHGYYANDMHGTKFISRSNVLLGPGNTKTNSQTSGSSISQGNVYAHEGETERDSATDRSPGSTGSRSGEEYRPSHHYPSSMTNLSLTSELTSSSHSSGSYGGQGSRSRGEERLRAEDLPREERISSQRQTTISPAGKQRQQMFATQRRSYLDVSPHGSNHSSPRGSRRNLMGASDENLSASGRQRLAASHSGPGQRSGLTNKTSPSSTFQEDLMRLIDPDVSFSEPLNISEEETHPHRRRKHTRSPHLPRTTSEESVAAKKNGVRVQANGPVESYDNGDVFSGTLPQGKPPTGSTGQEGLLDREQKLSPRATTDASVGTLIRVRTTQVASSNPSIPLPDTASDIDWTNLVDVASKFDGNGTDLNNKSVSMGAIGDHQDTKDGHSKLKNSRSGDLPGGAVGYHARGQEARGQEARGQEARGQDRLCADPGPRSSSSSAQRRETNAQRVAELEARVLELEQLLERERLSHHALEDEVHQLRQDNVRLQEESQTAASQLRKFTEWFFNTIDR